MSQLLNKFNKFHTNKSSGNANKSSDNTFTDNFLAIPFKPPTVKHNKMDIHSAASMGVYEIVEEYIIKDPHLVNARNRRGWTPLMYAAQAGEVEVCKLLLMKGALVESKNNVGKNSRDLANDWGHLSVVNLLNENKISA